jgi:phage protein D
VSNSVDVTVYAGASSPQAVPATFIDALDHIVVRQVHDDASTFQLVLNADLPARLASDLPIITAANVAPGNRVKIALSLGSAQQCIMDGVVVHQELGYDGTAGAFSYSVIGEDLSVYMRIEEKSAQWPARSAAQVAREIIETYSAKGLTTTIVTPASDYAPPENQWVRQQNGSDLEYLRKLGRPFGHLFAVRPGASISATSVAYWGPPARDATPLPALSVQMGSWTNVESINFAYDASASETYTGGSRSDLETDEALAVASGTFSLTSLANTSSSTSALQQTRRYVAPAAIGAIATAYAGALLQESTRRALRARAVIDGLVYGTVITPASILPVRGCGSQHDGLYYVERVDHTIARGSYKQEVVMTREGLGKTISEAT